MKRSGFKRKSYDEARQALRKRQGKKPSRFGLSRKSLKKKSVRMKRFAKTNQYKEEQWKKAVRARDAFQCQFPKCFHRSRSIDVHHIAMRSRRPDLKFVQTNGVCLCREHHEYIHRHPQEGVALGLLVDEIETYEAARKKAA